MNRYASARLHMCKKFDEWSGIALQVLLWRAPSSFSHCTLGDKLVEKWGRVTEVRQSKPSPLHAADKLAVQTGATHPALQ